MKFKIIFIILFIGQNIYSQNGREWNIGVEGVFTTKGLFSYPKASIKLDNVKIQSGVLIGKEYAHSATVLGGQIDFILFPNKEDKKTFNLFFISSTNYFKNNVSLNQSEVKTNFIQTTLGYGFNYNFSKSLLLKSNMGIGVLLENRKFSFDTNDPTNKWGVAGIISFGIAYRL